MHLSDCSPAQTPRGHLMHLVASRGGGWYAQPPRVGAVLHRLPPCASIVCICTAEQTCAFAHPGAGSHACLLACLPVHSPIDSVLACQLACPPTPELAHACSLICELLPFSNTFLPAHLSARLLPCLPAASQATSRPPAGVLHAKYKRDLPWVSPSRPSARLLARAQLIGSSSSGGGGSAATKARRRSDATAAAAARELAGCGSGSDLGDSVAGGSGGGRLSLAQRMQRQMRRDVSPGRGGLLPPSPPAGAAAPRAEHAAAELSSAHGAGTV
eukprot:33483-Chlamydomonas_euryale.AAC.1